MSASLSDAVESLRALVEELKLEFGPPCELRVVADVETRSERIDRRLDGLERSLGIGRQPRPSLSLIRGGKADDDA